MSFPELPSRSHPIWGQVYQPHQPTFGPMPGNPAGCAWGHGHYPTYRYPQGPSWYGPLQTPNYFPPGGAAYYPTAPQKPHPPYGGGYYSTTQWNTNPEPYENHDRLRHDYPHPANGHGVSAPYAQHRPVDLSQHQHFHSRYAAPTVSETPAPVHRRPSGNEAQFLPNPNVAPPATAPYQLAETLIPNVSRYPSVDWDITLPVESAHLLISPKDQTEIDFSQLAIYPPVRTVYIVARKDATPLGLALKRWGPIDIKSDKPLTIGDILNEIRMYFDTSIHSDEQRHIDESLLAKARASNAKRWNAQVHDRKVWPEIASRTLRRADTLFDNFQYGGLGLHKDFHRNGKIELTLENPHLKYMKD